VQREAQEHEPALGRDRLARAGIRAHPPAHRLPAREERQIGSQPKTTVDTAPYVLFIANIKFQLIENTIYMPYFNLLIL
jgi:hypothetical protein